MAFQTEESPLEEKEEAEELKVAWSWNASRRLTMCRKRKSAWCNGAGVFKGCESRSSGTAVRRVKSSSLGYTSTGKLFRGCKAEPEPCFHITVHVHVLLPHLLSAVAHDTQSPNQCPRVRIPSRTKKRRACEGDSPIRPTPMIAKSHTNMRNG